MLWAYGVWLGLGTILLATVRAGVGSGAPCLPGLPWANIHLLSQLVGLTARRRSQSCNQCEHFLILLNWHLWCLSCGGFEVSWPLLTSSCCNAFVAFNGVALWKPSLRPVGRLVPGGGAVGPVCRCRVCRRPGCRRWCRVSGRVAVASAVASVPCAVVPVIPNGLPLLLQGLEWLGDAR